MKRNIIEIDEELCDGCGICADVCHEGAIRMVDGKAKLVSDIYCDGLGDCIGECPQGAITIIEREAEAYDETVVKKSVEKKGQVAETCACPGSRLMDLHHDTPGETSSISEPESISSRLRNWPVQIKLVPPNAPWLHNTDILLVADCVPFAYADFHRKFLEKAPVIIGWPKLDDAQFYGDKIAEMLKTAQPKSLTVVRMEVPCCGGMTQIARYAVSELDIEIPVREVVIGIRGDFYRKTNSIREEHGKGKDFTTRKRVKSLRTHSARRHDQYLGQVRGSGFRRPGQAVPLLHGWHTMRPMF